MYIKANNDLISVDKFIRAEFRPEPYNNNSTITIIYTVDGQDKNVISVFSNISKNSIELLAEALKNNKNYVDISKNA